jgi:hypothetical protein
MFYSDFKSIDSLLNLYFLLFKKIEKTILRQLNAFQTPLLFRRTFHGVTSDI